ncbi:hypothetical protein C0580_02405 [Candidatus Parcubacteria bacterium]|nr:MAG: hypothetical protein C0580_02405 [Candidatus Parcubacteria bacterium]
MDRPIVGTGIIIFKEGKILLGLRKKKIGHNEWQFAGGKVDLFEDFETTVLREAKEETNLDVTNVRFVGVTNDIYKDFDRHYITLFFACDYKSGPLFNNEPEKAQDWTWYDPNNLPQPLFLPVKNLLKQNIDFSQYADK